MERFRRGVSYRAARTELRDMIDRAHPVKRAANGLELWRGPKPRRIRFYVDDRGSVVTVMMAFDGERR